MKNVPQGVNKVFWFSRQCCFAVSSCTQNRWSVPVKAFMLSSSQPLPPPGLTTQGEQPVFSPQTLTWACLSSEGETKGAENKKNGGHERDKVDKFLAGGGCRKEEKERGEGPGSEWTLNLCYRYFHSSAVSHCFGPCAAYMTLLRQ